MQKRGGAAGQDDGAGKRDEQAVLVALTTEEQLEQRAADDADGEADHDPFGGGDRTRDRHVTGMANGEQQTDRHDPDEGVDGGGDLELAQQRAASPEVARDDANSRGRGDRGDGAE